MGSTTQPNLLWQKLAFIFAEKQQSLLIPVCTIYKQHIYASLLLESSGLDIRYEIKTDRTDNTKYESRRSFSSGSFSGFFPRCGDLFPHVLRQKSLTLSLVFHVVALSYFRRCHH
jgi:hypothetical protein